MKAYECALVKTGFALVGAAGHAHAWICRNTSGLVPGQAGWASLLPATSCPSVAHTAHAPCLRVSGKPWRNDRPPPSDVPS
jgi:hypothetical protein